MRHRVGHRKLGRVTEHRIAMLRNQAHALLLHEHIETTVPKAKELRPFVERIITLAKRGVAARRRRRASRCTRAAWSCATSRTATVVSKLFDTIAPRFEARPGGYTRILRLGYRRGDSAEVAQIELVGSEYDPNAETKKAAGRGQGRSRRASAAGCAPPPSACAARRPNRPKGEAAEEGAPKKAKPPRDNRAKASRADTRGKGAKTSTPRKAGGIVSNASCQLQLPASSKTKGRFARMRAGPFVVRLPLALAAGVSWSRTLAAGTVSYLLRPPRAPARPSPPR